MEGVERASSIIHAAGVRFGFHHRRQRRARELVANGWAALPRLGGPFELATEVLEIIRADAQAEHFLDHWQEVSQRTDRAQWCCIGGPPLAARPPNRKAHTLNPRT